MPLPSWFENLLHSGQASGLSGIPSLQLSANPERDWFLRFLRSHVTVKSLAESPERVWSEPLGQRNGTGLRDHLLDLQDGATLASSEICVILSRAELADAHDQHGPAWTLRVEDFLSKKAASLLVSRGIGGPTGDGSFTVRILADGDGALGGRMLNLLPGEFVTALLPNRLFSETPSVMGVYVHVPGAWEGFRPVDNVVDGQCLYTFGNHWLDNFSHESLPEGALYQLRREEGGRWVHSVHPDYRDDYALRRTQQSGAMDVVTLCSKNGSSLLDVQLVLLGRTLDGLQGPVESTTVVPDRQDEGLLSLEECGVLLQRVHFPEVMRGYEVYLGDDGSLRTSMNNPVATLEVRGHEARLVANTEQVVFNGERLALGASVLLSGACEIQVGPHVLLYKDLSNVRAVGWPYIGEIRCGGWQSHLPVGGSYTIGRDAKAWVRLPDVADNRNIRWADETSSASVDSRTGTFARKDFYTDSIMVASEHAQINLGDGAVLENLAKHCHTYVRRASALVSLLPRKKAGLHRFQLQHGDELLVGNCVFSVGGSVPAGEDQTAPGSAVQ